MRVLFALPVLALVCCCIGSGGTGSTTTTSSTIEKISFEDSLKGAREHLSALGTFEDYNCRELSLENSELSDCTQCWVFTFTYECENRYGLKGMPDPYRAAVTTENGRVTNVAEVLVGEPCILDGDCLPDEPTYDIRYSCEDNICSKKPFDDLYSLFCINKGNHVQVRMQATRSVYGVCIFSNGNECETLAYYYGRCSWNTSNLTECPQFTSDHTCTSEYNPVCANVRTGDVDSYTYEWRAYSNSCAACTHKSKDETIVSYRFGDCPPTTTTTLKSTGTKDAAIDFCESRGYLYRIRKYPSGREYGVCMFSLGDECRIEEFFKGECGPI